MRPLWWAFILMGFLTCSVTYHLTNQPSLTNQLPEVSDESKPQPIDQKSDRPLIGKDEARLQEGNSSLADLNPDELPVAHHARLEAAALTGTIEFSNSNYIKQDLSYLAFYAYSELPPETKPADTVLNSLKGIPHGTPVEEIKRVADLLGLDFTFMKTVAKIKSNFDPTQRTGSYIGLFQLSNYEFQKYGSGDIRVSRENTVAAALKIMTEGILFEMFTHRKPTLHDLYLIHQQGVEGAAEHVSHPKRLAWRSMCAPTRARKRAKNGANVLFGAIHSRQSNVSGKP